MPLIYLPDGTPARVFQPSDLSVTGTAAGALTLTLPAAGAGLFHYITSLVLGRAAAGALTGTAVLIITSTNLPGSWAHSIGNAMVAGGTQRDVELMLSGNPLRSSVANTATTVVMPSPGVGVTWRAWATYYVAP